MKFLTFIRLALIVLPVVLQAIENIKDALDSPNDIDVNLDS